MEKRQSALPYNSTKQAVERKSSVKTLLEELPPLQFYNYSHNLDSTTDSNRRNQVETILKQFGISLRDSANEWRELEDVVDDIGNKWSELTSVEKSAIATQVAGKVMLEHIVIYGYIFIIYQNRPISGKV